MRTATRLVIAFLLSLVVLASPPLAADEETVDLMTDDGRLDRSWFGAVAPEFHRCEEERCELDGDEVAYDYLWVRPGFSLEGRTLHLAPWEPGAFRGEAQVDQAHGFRGTTSALGIPCGLLPQDRVAGPHRAPRASVVHGASPRELEAADLPRR